MSSAEDTYIYISWTCNQPCTGPVSALLEPAGLCINMNQHTDTNLKEQAGEVKTAGMKGRLSRGV